MKKIVIAYTLMLSFLLACQVAPSNNREPSTNFYQTTDTVYPVSKEIVKKPTISNSNESSTFKKGKLQLKVMGFKNIKEESYPWFCCSDDDSILFSTGFSAYSEEGERVEGCFCSGFMKGITIRFK